MSSAYGALDASIQLPQFLPIIDSLKDGRIVNITSLDGESEAIRSQLHQLLNDIIKEGNTYPHEYILTLDQFNQYFKTGFVCLDSNKNVLGGFYIKPNFPGRCSHICNGGFIVMQDERGKGVGKVMGKAYLKLAPDMGYRASIFNLVFEDNVASVKLWSGLGFNVVGRVPRAGRLNGKENLVDALVLRRVMAKLESYMNEFLEALNEQDGIKLSKLLSYRDNHGDQIYKQLKKISNLQNYINSRISSMWAGILICHCQVLLHLDQPIPLAELQNILAQNFHSLLGQQTRWCIPIMIMINQELQNASSLADDFLLEAGEKADNLEKAARTMNKAFSLCATDRYSALEESRKWGTYAIINILFKTYFKLSSTNLCSTILRSLSSADLPQLEEYPKADQVTFKYYTGVLAFLNEKFESASSDLLFAIRHGSLEEDPSTITNKILILRYLIPTQLLRGLLPREEIFLKYQSLAVYQSLVHSIREGNLHQFDQTFQNNQQLLIKWGTWLIIEKARLLVVRQLFRKIWSTLEKPSRLHLSTLTSGVCYSTKTNVSQEQVSCLVVNLISQNMMKGYISFEKQILVLSNKNPFPRFQK